MLTRSEVFELLRRFEDTVVRAERVVDLDHHEYTALMQDAEAVRLQILDGVAQ